MGDRPAKVINKHSNNNDVDIKHIEICLKCIDTYNDYSSWVEVGMILKNITNDIKLFLDWASQSSKYDEDENINKFNSFKIEGGLNMGSLVHMAKQNNLELYNELMKELKPQKLEIDLYNLNTTEIANHFKLKFSHKFIYQKEQLYCYNGIYWKMENKKSMCSLNNFIGDEYFNYLYKLVSNEEASKLKDKNVNSTDVIEKFNKIRGYLTNLKNFDKRQKYINDILLKLNNDDIEFDKNPYLFAFENKIYDLEKHEFIEPSADQYISLTTGYYWDDKAPIDKSLVHKIIDTIFPDPDIKKLYLPILSSGLNGKPLEKFIIANGSGGNGKGLLNEFVFSVLGNYSYILPSTILLNPLKCNGANVEISAMNKKRLIIAREPDSKFKINTSIHVVCRSDAR